MAQRLRSSGRAIFRAVSLRHLGGATAEGRDGTPFLRALALANLKRKASNGLSAVQDTVLSTKEVFESHRIVFTVGTSIASVLTAWAGYSLRQYHQINVEKRLESIEKAMTKNYDAEHEEFKRVVNSGNVSTAACIATAGTSLLIGSLISAMRYGFGWRGGLWFANRKFKREQLKLMGQLKPHGWQILRRPFVRFRRNNSVHKTAEPPSTNTPSSSEFKEMLQSS